MPLLKQLPITRSPGEAIGLTNTQDGSVILISIDKTWIHEEKVCLTLNLPKHIQFCSVPRHEAKRITREALYRDKLEQERLQRHSDSEFTTHDPFDRD